MVLLAFATTVYDIRSKCLDNSLDNEVVEQFLVPAQVCGMKSGGDDTHTVVFGFTQTEVVPVGGYAVLDALAPLDIVAEDFQILLHQSAYTAGDGVLERYGI